MATPAICANDGCRDPVPPRNRVYCAKCSSLASAIWKRRRRAEYLAEWKAGETSADPRLDGWPDIEARRRYYREYMRGWRKRKKAERDGAGLPASTGSRPTARFRSWEVEASEQEEVARER